jgi:hypothetical protein
MTTMINLTDEELVEKRFLLEKLLDLMDGLIETWLLRQNLKAVMAEISKRDLGAVEFNISLKWTEDELPCHLVRVDNDDFFIQQNIIDFVNGIKDAESEN